jgi:hypothetical protein
MDRTNEELRLKVRGRTSWLEVRPTGPSAVRPAVVRSAIKGSGTIETGVGAHETRFVLSPSSCQDLDHIPKILDETHYLSP